VLVFGARGKKVVCSFSSLESTEAPNGRSGKHNVEQNFPTSLAIGTITREHPDMHDGRSQYGTECFCGKSDNLDDYKVNGPGSCDMVCPGDKSLTCGGYWSLSLYKYGGDATFSGGMYGTTYSGDGTYYGFTTEGNCAYKDNVPGMYAGMTPSERQKNMV